MNNRALAKLLPPLLVIGGIMWVIENYGKAILITFALIFSTLVLWVIFNSNSSRHDSHQGNSGSRNELNSENDKYNFDFKPNLELDLYIAIKRNKIAEAKRLIRSGANPFATFNPNSRPSSTDAKNCYEFVKDLPNRKKFLTLFEQYR